MFRHVSEYDLRSRRKHALWTFLALVLGPVVWLALLIYKQRQRSVMSGYVPQSDARQSQYIPRRDIIIQNPMPAVGGFGQVFRGEWQGNFVAVKELLVHPLPDRGRRAFENEADIMRKINHTNCVHLIGTCGPPDRFALVMEWMNGGNLYEALGRLPPNQPLPVHKRVSVMRQISCSMEYLHSKHVVHGDIKSENVMLSDPNCDGEAKLTDFGLSSVRSSMTGSAGQLMGGSYHNLSPEMLCDGQTSSPESDVYAFGMLVYEAVLGRRAWDGLNIAQVVAQLQAGHLPNWDPAPLSGLSNDTYRDIQALVLDCCCRDPNQRLKARVVKERLAVLDINNPVNHTELKIVPELFQSPCTSLLQCLDHVNAHGDVTMRNIHGHANAWVQHHLATPGFVQFIHTNGLSQVEAQCIAAYTWDHASPHAPFRAFNTACRTRDIASLVLWRHFSFHILKGLSRLPVEPPCQLFRGLAVKLTEVNGFYRQGKVILWTQLISFTTDRAVAARFSIGGTLLLLNCRSARNIEPASYFGPFGPGAPKESERIILPNTRFRVDQAVASDQVPSLARLANIAAFPPNTDLVILTEM